ncbi:MAG TPA: YfiR family protein [Dongiaceae bacterium]|nr:YfiR family protein [Dongiaceae bacterium]
MPARLQAEDAYQIKAAFLYNFTKFVTWPAEMEQQGGDLRLCIFNSNPFGEYLYQLSGRKVRNFELKVIQPTSASELESCAILFLVGASNREQMLEKLATRPILTVSDQEDFAVDGGAIELLSENNRIRFDVNLQTVRDSGLKMSSKLLQLARQVR